MSTSFRNYAQQQTGRAPFRMQAGQLRKSAKYFFMQLNVPFTSTANEIQPGSTENKDWPNLVRGATTELNLKNRMKLTDPSSGEGYQLSMNPVPFAEYCSQTQRALAYKWWDDPYELGPQQVLLASFINDAANAAGNICLFCEKKDTYLWHVIDNDCSIFDLDYSFAFTGVANFGGNELISVPNLPAPFDLLILGAQYTGLITTNTVQILEESSNYLWSTNFLRWEYFFGLIDQPSPLLLYPIPYFLPTQGRLIVKGQSTNAQTTGTFRATFRCLRGFSTFASQAEARAYAQQKYPQRAA